MGETIKVEKRNEADIGSEKATLSLLRRSRPCERRTLVLCARGRPAFNTWGCPLFCLSKICGSGDHHLDRSCAWFLAPAFYKPRFFVSYMYLCPSYNMRPDATAGSLEAKCAARAHV